MTPLERVVRMVQVWATMDRPQPVSVTTFLYSGRGLDSYGFVSGARIYEASASANSTRCSGWDFTAEGAIADLARKVAEELKKYADRKKESAQQDLASASYLSSLADGAEP